MKDTIPMIKQLSFTHYRAFKAWQAITLAPITLIFGYNNSGKSALLRSLAILADSFKMDRPPTYLDSCLDYASPAMRGAIHRDLTFQGTNRLEFELSWQDGTRFGFSLKQYSDEIEYADAIKLTIDSRQYEFVLSLTEANKDFNYYESKADATVKLQRKNLQLQSDQLNLDRLNQLTAHFAQSVYSLNAIRLPPPREFAVGLGTDIRIKPNGTGTAELLWYLAAHQCPAFADINQWLIETCGRKLDMLDSVKHDGLSWVKLETIIASTAEVEGYIGNDQYRISIVDSGEGIAQALPVVTLCAQAANGALGTSPIIIIEQPELHLHPKAIISLANFIVSCMQKNPQVIYLIETHSESFLLALQLALVEKRLSLSQFSCYWVTTTAQSSEVQQVGFDEDGYILDNWPDEVFGEVMEQTRQLLLARDK